MQWRQRRGIADILVYPLKDGSGIHITGVTGITPQIATWAEATTTIPSTFKNIAGGCQEIGSTGVYWSSLTASEKSADYVYFLASPTSGSARRFDVTLICTALASVTNVGSVSYAVPLNWASISSPGATNVLSGTTVASASNVATCNFVASVASVVLSNVGTVTGVTNSVSVATITGVTNAVGVREGTGGNQLNLSSGRVGINWNDILNPTSTQNLTGTTIASANNVATCNFVASQSSAMFGTITGVTNTVGANLIQWLTVVPNVLTGGRVDSYAAVLNWASVTAPSTSVNLSGTTIATVDGVTSSVSPDWGRIINPTSTVNLTNTTVASASNVATCQFVASVSNAVLTNVATVTGVTNRVDATLTTVAGQMLADRLLARNLAMGSDGTRTVQDAFRLLRNRRALTTGAMETATLTAYQENDTTVAWTAIVGTASAVGLTDVDAS